jgi:hypothetical protein
MTQAPHSVAAEAIPHRSRRGRLLVILAVFGGIAIGLRALDHVPPWWLGQPRAPVYYASVQEFERQQRTRLLLPFLFPDTLVWPPRRVTLAPGPGRPVLIEFERADGAGLGLALAQALDGDVALPERLVPPVELSPVPNAAVGTETGIDRGRAPDGREFFQISEVVEGRRVILRWYDPDPALLRRIARSLRRG